MEEDVAKRRDDVMYERLYHKYHLHGNALKIFFIVIKNVVFFLQKKRLNVKVLFCCKKVSLFDVFDEEFAKGNKLHSCKSK